MNNYQVRIRYAGSVLLDVKADSEGRAREKGERIVQQMDSSTFLAALEPQHLGTAVTRLCSICQRELQTREKSLCRECEGK